MKAYESMTKKLKPTGLYLLEENAAVSSELKTYSEGIDSKDDELDVIIREAFVASAEDYGLSMWEELFGAVQNGVDVQRRRELIKARMKLSNLSFTPAGVQEIIRSLGIDSFDVSENPSLNLLTIDLSAQSYSKARRRWIKEQLEELLPAHLEIVVIFGNASWNYIDSLQLTADQMDAKGYTWNSIDTLIIDA
ncbi:MULTISPECIES: putative phage tail protein [unclassified Ruminococcus]|uniref:putative phage tail protein n=1 Tax=unclassified Ruminococcus TaxID=2608920 RepID=UPI0021094007|nr:MULTISPECIES: putative phage tail protein [unclassified Ruminococcus]MCQ4021536.1 DUF2313 domain-containing protein [Ruminococcus sp. zg-924]MCQ4113981.1 DUF2313 domain-containing protein [Ruminococcus sp. zg-921]